LSWQRPSLGFSLVVLTYGLTLAFFAWGLGTPPLDRVWQLHHELKIGRVYKLEQVDRELLLSSMARHPALAAALLPSGQIGIISAHRDGWIDTPHVTIIRTPRSSATLRIVLNVQTPPQHIPYAIEVDGTGWERKLAVESRGVVTIDLPPPPRAPELVTLRLVGDGFRADPSSLGVRISFDPPESQTPEDDDDRDGQDDGEEEDEE
jgi:hypothetical protein